MCLVFLLLFLLTGILYQRISDIVAFFISALMLTIYVIFHYVARLKGPDSGGKDATIRLVSAHVCPTAQRMHLSAPRFD